MPICPECGKENRADAKACAGCGMELPKDLLDPKPATDADGGGELAELADFNTVAEAEMIKELLESNGISSILRGETDPIGSTSRAEAITLLVEKQDLSNALELYEAFFSGETVTDELTSTEDE